MVAFVSHRLQQQITARCWQVRLCAHSTYRSSSLHLHLCLIDRSCTSFSGEPGVLQGVKFDLQLPPKCKLIAQPPADLAEGDAAMLHYTWGSIWKDDAGKEVWSFDKRFYTDAKLELEVILAAVQKVQFSTCIDALQISLASAAAREQVRLA